MEAWEERLRHERENLAGMLDRLSTFLSSGKAHVSMGHDAYGLLVAQETVMRSYLDILDRRIALI